MVFSPREIGKVQGKENINKSAFELARGKIVLYKFLLPKFGKSRRLGENILIYQKKVVPLPPKGDFLEATSFSIGEI